MKLKYILAFTLSGLILIGCEDFLDRKLDSAYTGSEVFQEYNTMRDFGAGIYTFLPSGYSSIGGAMLASACDEAHHANENSVIHRYATGAWNASSNPDDKWNYYYKGIRKANLFIEGSADFEHVLAKRDTISDPSKEIYREQWDNIYKLRAEARFLRAFFYFELVKRYGGVPLILNTLDLNDDFQYRRNTIEECFDFIIRECEDIQDVLPLTWLNYGIPKGDKIGIGNCPGVSGTAGQAKIGRATKATALALKLRAAVYAASPLFAGEKNNQDKWNRAAEYGKEYFSQERGSVPDYLDRGTKVNDPYLQLYTPAYSTSGYIKGEVIFEKRWKNGNDFEKANYPVSFENGGGNTTCPTQNFVDVFKMLRTSNVYDPQKPYNNRDPRLDLIVVRNESAYNSSETGVNTRKLETYEGGADGIGKFRSTTTGYYLRKYVDPTLDLKLGKTSWHSYVIFGLREVYLNYAEALNHVCSTPNSKTASNGTVHSKSARELINAIRSLHKVGPYTLWSYPLNISTEDMEKAIRDERMIELAFEDHRFFDIRRWRLLDDPIEKENILTIRGMHIVKADDGSLIYDENYIVEKRVWNDNMYLYPIPLSEIMKSNGLLIQNIGW